VKIKKQTGLLLMVFVVLAFGMGCGEENAINEVPTVTVKPVQKQEEVPEEQPKGYLFEYKGVCIAMDMEADEIIRELGEPISCFEATSCVFDGTDKIYNYGSFELDTYELNGKDYISCIYFRDDLVTTREGISLFMSRDELFAAYGERDIAQNGEYIYEKDSMQLRFLIKEGEITSIEYRSSVWNFQ